MMAGFTYEPKYKIGMKEMVCKRNLGFGDHTYWLNYEISLKKQQTEAPIARSNSRWILEKLFYRKENK